MSKLFFDSVYLYFETSSIKWLIIFCCLNIKAINRDLVELYSPMVLNALLYSSSFWYSFNISLKRILSSSSLKAYSNLLQDCIYLRSTLFSCSSSFVIAYCSYCSMTDRLNLRTKTQTRDRGVLCTIMVVRHFSLSPLSNAIDYQNA